MAFFLKLKLQDSVNQTAVSRYLYVIIMATCIVYCHSLPVTTEAETTSPWWCQPCQNQHRTRHSRAINELLKNQFELAIIHFKNQVAPYIKQIHTKIGNITKNQFSKSKWLPRKKFFQTLKKDNVKILPELLYQLQVYALTIDKLSKMEIRSEDSSLDLEERSNAMNSIKGDINLLRCETEQEIAEKRQKITKKVPLNLVDKKIPDSVNHLTEGLIKDFSLLKNYSNFLNKCYAKIFGNPKKNKKRNRLNGEKSKTIKRTKNKINKKVSAS